MELLAGFVDVRKPVLGICRGAQLINVAYGGTLWQDIPSMVPAALRHHDPELYDENFHPLRFEPGSLLEKIFPGQQSGLVNSIHHQAVRDLGTGLIVEGRGEADGVIEAIRWDGPSFVYGMQWHPEFHLRSRRPARLHADPGGVPARGEAAQERMIVCGCARCGDPVHADGLRACVDNQGR